MDRNAIEKIAQSGEDRLLLAKLWDKINAGIRKNIPAHTCFLSPRELEMARFLFGNPEGLYLFGGYSDAERKMLVYLPEYLEESTLCEEESPCVCGPTGHVLSGRYPQPPGLSGSSHGRRHCPGNGRRHLRGHGKL